MVKPLVDPTNLVESGVQMWKPIVGISPSSAEPSHVGEGSPKPFHVVQKRSMRRTRHGRSMYAGSFGLLIRISASLSAQIPPVEISCFIL